MATNDVFVSKFAKSNIRPWLENHGATIEDRKDGHVVHFPEGTYTYGAGGADPFREGRTVPMHNSFKIPGQPWPSIWVRVIEHDNVMEW